MQTECIVREEAWARVEVAVRFLQLTERRVGECTGDLGEGGPEYRLVRELEIEGKRYLPWQEAQEREIVLGEFSLESLCEEEMAEEMEFPGREWAEVVKDESGRNRVVLLRREETVRAKVEIAAAEVGEHLYRLRVRVKNETAAERGISRDEAAMRGMISTHTLLGCTGGAFVSMTDATDGAAEAVGGCRNIGAWPVLVGGIQEAPTMLSSPIILEDNPRIAPESPGDFFDGTEMDEMLTLRILTLTQEEKRAMAAVDARGRARLERTESQAGERMMALHGKLREPELS